HTRPDAQVNISRLEEERLAQEMRNNERILRHNENELRHWKAAVQEHDAELVKRHADDCGLLLAT
ncbi:MAG: hypothetical protein ACPIOQ_82080, partial [Promethearchaeia archaeon]